jgi:hypothetical protein
MQKIYRIHQSAEERDSVTELTTSSKPIGAKKTIKVQALLPADESYAGPPLRDLEILKRWNEAGNSGPTPQSATGPLPLSLFKAPLAGAREIFTTREVTRTRLG